MMALHSAVAIIWSQLEPSLLRYGAIDGVGRTGSYLKNFVVNSRLVHGLAENNPRSKFRNLRALSFFRGGTRRGPCGIGRPGSKSGLAIVRGIRISISLLRLLLEEVRQRLGCQAVMPYEGAFPR